MDMTKKMIQSHPLGAAFSADELENCITECFSCAQACTACADACLNEQEVSDLKRCIRLNLDCADICLATGRIMSRLGHISEQILREQLKTCMTACDFCGSECNSHQQHEHCKVCAEACYNCKDVCDSMLSGMMVQDRSKF
jgi:hypothetical protein